MASLKALGIEGWGGSGSAAGIEASVCPSEDPLFAPLPLHPVVPPSHPPLGRWPLARAPCPRRVGGPSRLGSGSSPAFLLCRSDGRRTSRWGSPQASCIPGGGACGAGVGRQWRGGGGAGKWENHHPPAAHSVFWDLYCAAPDRREACEHSSEAKAFQDYVSPAPGTRRGQGGRPGAGWEGCLAVAGCVAVGLLRRAESLASCVLHWASSHSQGGSFLCTGAPTPS